MIRFPIVDTIATWFRNNKPEYIVWVILTGCTLGTGITMWLSEMVGYKLVLIAGGIIWLIGGVVIGFMTGRKKHKSL